MGVLAESSSSISRRLAHVAQEEPICCLCSVPPVHAPLRGSLRSSDLLKTQRIPLHGGPGATAYTLSSRGRHLLVILEQLFATRL
jgi:hypothetical protein